MPKEKVIVVVDKRISAEDMRFIYQSGVDLILSNEEYFKNLKLGLFITHALKSPYVPVKSFNFQEGSEPDFKVYHLLSFKGVFVPVFHGPISKAKLEKAHAVNELYIHKEDLGKFENYLRKIPTTSETLLGRSRAKFLQFQEEYITLLFKLTDNSKQYTFDEGKKLLENLQNLSQDLLDIISSSGNPWTIVSNLSESSSYEEILRTPAIASYAGILSKELGLGDPKEVMLSAILCDLGLLDLHYKEKDEEGYKFHPLKSVNLVLDRRLPLDEKVRAIILHTHENFQGTGFPKGDINFERFPKEASLIQVCQKLDKMSLVSSGTLRPDLEQVKRSLLSNLEDSQELDYLLLQRLRRHWDLQKAS